VVSTHQSRIVGMPHGARHHPTDDMHIAERSRTTHG
jgi:hypothetical protein